MKLMTKLRAAALLGYAFSALTAAAQSLPAPNLGAGTRIGGLPFGQAVTNGMVTGAGTIYGTPIISPTSTAQFNANIAAAIASGATGVQLNPGTYTIAKTTTASDSSPAAILVNAPSSDFTLDGAGSTLVLSGADVPNYADHIVVQNAAAGVKITLKNLTLKYASPPFAQATVTSTTACVANANGLAVVQVLPNFAPTWSGVERIDNYDPTSGLWQSNIYDAPAARLSMSSLGGSAYALSFSGPTQCAALANMSVGASYTLQSTQFGSASGPFIDDIKILWSSGADIVLDNVKFVDAAGHGAMIVGAHDVTLKNGTGTKPLPGAVLTTNAGGIAVVYASGTLSADPTTSLTNTGDDSLFSAPYGFSVASVASPTSVTLAGQYPGTYIFVGDVLQFVDPTGALQGRATITAITNSGGNSVVTLAGAGAPSGVAAGWLVYDQSQAPALAQINGGTYGPSPTRGIFIDASDVQINSPHIRGTGSAAIFVQWGLSNYGLVPASVTINSPVVEMANYETASNNDAEAAAIDVEGWNLANTAPAPEGQIPNVSISDVTCTNVGSGCVYVSGAKNVHVTGRYDTWYTRAAVPALSQPGCALYTNALGFCNDTNVLYSGGSNAFLSGGSQLGTVGAAVSSIGNRQVLSGGILNGTLSANTTAYFVTYLSPYENSAGPPIPNNGVAHSLVASLNQDPGSGVTVTVSWRANQSTSPLTCTITGNGSNQKSCQDDAHGQPIAATQQWDFQVVTVGSIAANTVVQAAVEFDVQ